MILLVFAPTAGSAQDQQPETGRPAADGNRPSLMLQLGLSAEQIQQIRELNAGRKPQMAAAQIALRGAVKALDEAIYADVVDERLVTERIRELQAAQSEVVGLRFSGELALRKILTADQLTKFRELRRRFGGAARAWRRGRRNQKRLPTFRQMNRQDNSTKNIQ